MASILRRGSLNRLGLFPTQIGFGIAKRQAAAVYLNALVTLGVL